MSFFNIVLKNLQVVESQIFVENKVPQSYKMERTANPAAQYSVFKIVFASLIRRRLQ